MGARQVDTGTAGLVLGVADDGVATLRIDRPEAKGALTAAMWAAIPAILDGLAHDPEVRVLVLTGTDGVFSAGADIRELRGHYATAESADAYHALNAAAERALAAFPKPTIALVQGPCVGGGCQLAVACDLRFADANARFGVTPAKLGIVYDAGSAHRLARVVGVPTAKYLLFSAELIDSQKALRVGLVEDVYMPQEAEEKVYAFARTIASRSQLTVRAAKDLLGSDTVDPERVRAWERRSRESSDVREGLAAFTERRAPHFTWGVEE
ncbi:enoyl-CoA hydratase/isomerase family protein [Yinghuangia seranimata]|uniref:enoyl-CoA hydratase/isomerase family protein n=1 Tax=Yinghuangia seranimata TaxID=408067 RepID=UPI00248A98D8|nr:enoyl-CoA hydratase/isomerase family protein [Yinghuangia seranimata]MDI2131493.1 enoyl-CoA hydratase/isomerase family protein [Yinghuangia seranimata]